MNILMKEKNSSYVSQLNRLKLPLKNKLRAIISAKEKDAIDLINKLREKESAVNIYQIEKALSIYYKDSPILPSLFPKDPQTTENFVRLESIQLNKLLEIIDYHIKNNYLKLSDYFDRIYEINANIFSGNYVIAEKLISLLIDDYGYSQFIIRKALLITVTDSDNKYSVLQSIISKCGLKNNIITSLLYCYKEEQDYLSIKRSVMGTKDLGDSNKYTRDILRVGFHPHATDESDLSNLIQSCLQSSIIDSILIINVNKRILKIKKYNNLHRIIKFLESNNEINKILDLYSNVKSSEDLFFQCSNAWYENDDIIKYRLLIDNFYDDPDSKYIKIDKYLINDVSKWIKADNIESLINSRELTTHRITKLLDFENEGTLTRSAIFNYLVFIKEGNINYTEDQIIALMGITSGLSRTINIEYIRALALCNSSDLCNLIFYLLIFKKSKNELDSYKVRRIFQKIVVDDYNGNIIDFIDSISKISPTISDYIYEVCNEDFVSKLSHIIKSSEMIFETRANLHQWMGEFKKDKSYLEKARKLKIDTQINIVKNELDDNRIYVDTTKFIEWMENEIMQDLTTLLILSNLDDDLYSQNSIEIKRLILKAYNEFCSNNLFGIASYLGRRLRHGTFKGHLFYSVVNKIEKDYRRIVNNPMFSPIWNKIKLEYESQIDNIVRNKLHVKSNKKPDGFLDPDINGGVKLNILDACVKNLYQDFEKNETSYTSLILINEYCWRISGIDMQNINSFLKNKKSSFIPSNLFNEIKSKAGMVNINDRLISEFERQSKHLINDTLSDTYGWFKKPQTVSPKASINLLYKAVVAEVKESFNSFDPDTVFSEEDDIEIIGGAYLLLYDALYVIVYNAAKHSKESGNIERFFCIKSDDTGKFVEIKISSEIKDDDLESDINSRLKIDENTDIDNAQIKENRSGIPKLYNLQKYDKNFIVDSIKCKDRKVFVEFKYRLVH